MLSCFLSWILHCLCDLCEGQSKRVFVWESVSHTNSVLLWSRTLLDRNRQWVVSNVNRGDRPEGGLLSEPMEKLHLSNSHTFTPERWDNSFQQSHAATSVHYLVVSTVYVWCEWTQPETKTNRPTAHSDAAHLLLTVPSDWLWRSEALSSKGFNLKSISVKGVGINY